MHCKRIWRARTQCGLHFFSYTLRDPGIGLLLFKLLFIHDVLWVLHGFAGWELEGCNSPLRPLFVEWPLLALWDETGLCRKTFKFRQIVFRACLGCFQSTQNWIELGIIWWKLSPAQLLPPGFELATFKPEDCHTLTIVLQDPCLWRILPSYCTHSLSLSFSLSLFLSLSLSLSLSAQPLWTSETIFQALIFFRIPLERWNAFFSRGLQGSSQALQKNIKKKHFFATWEFFFSALPLSALVKLIDARLYKKK